ncbi:hypothetical protein NMG60_11001287 [Bertholletia excelsa]
MEGGGEVKEETLPPGFRFHPTDEELITYYLINKISDSTFTGRAIADVDLNKSEPWDLPGKAKMGEKEWYFFSLRDRKYPTGVRTNRATNTGYWKTTGKDKEIYNSASSELVGMKKTLVFYRGRAPRGEKTNWVMHEYRIHSKSSFRSTKQDEWVVCRVFQKSAGGKKYPSNQSRAVLHPYNLEIGSSVLHSHSQMMQAHDAAAVQFPTVLGRSSYMSNAELALLRGAASGSAAAVNFPVHPQLNYPPPPAGGGGGGCFTISGLNLNLGGGGGRAMPPPPPGAALMSHHQQDGSAAASSMLSTTSCDPVVYGVAGDVNNASLNRFMHMDHCLDLDNYWPPPPY